MSGESDKMNLSVKTFEKLITAEEVLKIAKEATNDPNVRVLSYHFDVFSKEQVGFLGDHKNLKIILMKSNASQLEELNLFMKCVPYECAHQADFIIQQNIFVKEMIFFEKIVPLLLQDYKGEKWLPTCYLAKEDVLILEDLRLQNFENLVNIFDNTELLKLGLAALARFHSCSILAEARLQQRAPKSTLGECFPNAFGEIFFPPTGKPYLWFQGAVNIVAKIAERLGYESQNLRTSLDRIFDLVKPSKVHRNVIGHADTWKNNFMFNVSSPQQCILIDYQIIRYAPLVLDLLHFLYINTTRDYRKKSENELIEYYHSILEYTIRSNDIEGIAKIPSLDVIKYGMDDLRLFGLGVATLNTQVVLFDPETAKKCTDTSEKYENFIFGDRLDIVLNHMEENAFYKKVIEEAVIELVEFSERD